MRSRERLLALKNWTYDRVCRGRSMKAPDTENDITKIHYQEPSVFLGWHPSRPDASGMLSADPLNVCPGVLIAPGAGNVKNVEEHRFDTYKNVHRSQELGQWLNVSILFSVYEPGIRLPGFVESAERGCLDMSKFAEGTEEGLFTLLDWMDDFKDALVAEKVIPGSDLFVDEMSLTYSPYTEAGYIVDKRPLYYGFINAKFQCYAENKANRSIDKLLL